MQLGDLNSLTEVGIALNLAFVVVAQFKSYLHRIVEGRFRDAKLKIKAKFAETSLDQVAQEAAFTETDAAVSRYKQATEDVRPKFENFGIVVAFFFFCLLIVFAAHASVGVSGWWAVALGAVVVTPVTSFCISLGRRCAATCREIKAIETRYSNAIDGHLMLTKLKPTPPMATPLPAASSQTAPAPGPAPVAAPLATPRAANDVPSTPPPAPPLVPSDHSGIRGKPTPEQSGASSASGSDSGE